MTTLSHMEPLFTFPRGPSSTLENTLLKTVLVIIGCGCDKLKTLVLRFTRSASAACCVQNFKTVSLQGATPMERPPSSPLQLNLIHVGRIRVLRKCWVHCIGCRENIMRLGKMVKSSCGIYFKWPNFAHIQLYRRSG
jgi:hypothetical protein